jgi:hypothetical protein
MTTVEILSIGGTLTVLCTMPFVIWFLVARAAKRDAEANRSQLPQ